MPLVYAVWRLGCQNGNPGAAGSDMNGELAQNIALIAHGNVFLSGLGSLEELTVTNSTFQYVYAVEFVRIATRLIFRRQETVIAAGTADWFQQLKREGVNRLSLFVGRPFPGKLLPHVSVAFARRQCWGILAGGEKKAQLWSSSWQCEQPGTRKPWKVTYAANRRSRRGLRRAPDLVRRSAELAERLREIKTFAETQGLRDWAEWFERALLRLGDPSAAIRYHPDLLPTCGYSPLAREVVAAAVEAWVFGGMGSWNDLSIPAAKHLTYQRLSARLYDAVLLAIQDGVNSFAP